MNDIDTNKNNIPVPPDKFFNETYTEYANKVASGQERGGQHELYIMRQSAIWGYKEAMWDRQELAELLILAAETLSRMEDVCDSANLGTPIDCYPLKTETQLRAWAERLREGDSDG